MKQVRQDAWKKAEDDLLVQTVLHYISEGKTQLDAFKEVSQALNRTTAACGFRWNASLRKNYVDDIHIAKNNKKTAHDQMKGPAIIYSDEMDNIHMAINLLESFREVYEQEKHATVEQLRQENESLKATLHMYEKLWTEIDGVVRSREGTVHSESLFNDDY